MRQWYFCFLLSVASSAFAQIELIEASSVGGGFAIVKVQPYQSVDYLDQRFTADDEGFIGIGFNRLANGPQTIIQTEAPFHELTIHVTQRTYKEQRINGIDQAKVTAPKEVTDRIINEANLVREARAKQSSINFWRNEQFKVPVKGPVTGVYGSQRFYNGEARSPHWGIDYAAKEGTPVIAPASGVIVLAESDLYFSGGTIILDHGAGLSSSFLHLSALTVSVGQIVSQGEVVGLVGSTGRSTGPHLDWRMNLNGERIDAALWLSLD